MLSIHGKDRENKSLFCTHAKSFQKFLAVFFLLCFFRLDCFVVGIVFLRIVNLDGKEICIPNFNVPMIRMNFFAWF